MFHISKSLALAAVTLAGALLGTAAQASASNFNVSFVFKNADTSASMIRTTSPLPAGISGLPAPSSIAPGGYDPSTGNATYSLTLPTLGNNVHATIAYANSSDGVSNPCSFTITVSRDNNALPYLVHFSNNNVSRCVVPGDDRSSNGQFAGNPYVMTWATK